MKDEDQLFEHTEFKITMESISEDIKQAVRSLESRREAGIHVAGLGVSLTLQVVEAMVMNNIT